MKPRAFDYLRPESVEVALAALASHGSAARLLAGGQSQVAMLNFRLIEAEVLVDIGALEELRYIRKTGSSIEIGAATTQAELLEWPELAAELPLLARALPHLGHMQTRNRGTVCGSIAHSDPSSELPLCLTTLGGEVVLRCSAGQRTLAAGDFQTGMLSTARRADEMVAAVRYPCRQAGAGYAFDEMTLRKGDFAIVSLAAVADTQGLVLGIGGVADQPAVRRWGDLDDVALDDNLNALAWELGGYDDIHASARYRRELVRRLGKQVIEEARSCRS